MRQLGVACGTPMVLGKADLASRVDGTVAACPKSLESADFSGCIVDDRACAHAGRIHKSLDPSAAVLECREHHRPVTIREAENCDRQK